MENEKYTFLLFLFVIAFCLFVTRMDKESFDPPQFLTSYF